MTYPDKELIERLRGRTELGGPNGDCWVWKGNYGNAYGTYYHKGRAERAHKVAYVAANGPIAPYTCICHTCDNRRCVNPDHLWVGTYAENTADMWSKGRGFVPQLPGRAQPGERNIASKLTEAQVYEIRDLAAKGANATELSLKFNADPSNIRSIIRRDTWKHLPAREVVPTDVRHQIAEVISPKAFRKDRRGPLRQEGRERHLAEALAKADMVLAIISGNSPSPHPAKEGK